MPRGRRSSSASRSPPSRSKSRGPSRSQSRAPSRSKSRGPPLSRHPSSSGPAEKDHPSGSGSGPDLKNSLLFLGTIAAAAFTAHKVWPKGVLYGHKDDWEEEHEKHEHEKKSCRKTPHRQPERGRDRDRSPPPRHQTDRPAVYQTAAATNTTRRDAPFPEARRSGARPAATGPPPPPQQQQQPQRRYLPYEPGVYTPSSVTSSASTRAFEQRRERPVLLPLEGPRGHLPYVPPAGVGRRGNVFEDEGYASRESVPAARSFASRYQEERGEYR